MFGRSTLVSSLTGNAPKPCRQKLLPIAKPYVWSVVYLVQQDPSVSGLAAKERHPVVSRKGSRSGSNSSTAAEGTLGLPRRGRRQGRSDIMCVFRTGTNAVTGKTAVCSATSDLLH